MKLSRFRQAVLRWLSSRPDPAGIEALFVEPARSSASVGRHERFGAAILDTADWLEAHGWRGVGAGDRQVYAAWLLERRAAYERQGALR